MQFAEMVRQQAESLSARDSFALTTFWEGICAVDVRARALLVSLGERFGGRAEMHPFSRAALEYSSAEAAFELLLTELTNRLGEWSVVADVEVEHFAVDLIKFIEQGRPALVLGNEVSVSGMSDYLRGYLLAAKFVKPEVGARLEVDLAAFEAWLGKWYGVKSPWVLLLRCFEGDGPYGCQQFAKAWRRFEAERAR